MHLLPLLLAAALAAQDAPVPAGGSAKAGPAGLEVAWEPTWEGAVAAARKMPNGRILIEFADESCTQCEQMDQLIHPSTSFYAFVRDKVPVRLLRSSPDGRRLAERFGVPAAPAWVVTTPDLLLCGILVGGSSQDRWIETFRLTERSWALYQKKLQDEQKNPADTDLVFDIARETYKRGGNEAAEPRFQRLANDPKLKPALREQSLAYLASIKLDARRIDEAEKDLLVLLKTATDTVLRERAALRLADVDIARGQKQKAIQRLKEFRRTYPSSPRAAEAEELLHLLESGEGPR